MAEFQTPNEPWFTSRYRPALCWCYLFICLFDFVLAPITLGLFSLFTKVAYIAWVPLTLQGGGLFHLSFGAFLGITSYGRTREKLAFGGEPCNDTPANDSRAG